MTADDEQRRRDVLAGAAAALTTEVGQLSTRLEESSRRISELTVSNKVLGQRSKTHSRWIFGTVATIVVDVLVTIVVWLLFDQQSTLIEQQQRTTDRLELSVQESCAFFALVIGSYRPESRLPGPDREQYEANFRRMRQSYRVLECTEPLVPPATQAPPSPR